MSQAMSESGVSSNSFAPGATLEPSSCNDPSNCEDHCSHPRVSGSRKRRTLRRTKVRSSQCVTRPGELQEPTLSSAPLSPELLANVLFAYNLRVTFDPSKSRQVLSNPFLLFGAVDKGRKRTGVGKETPKSNLQLSDAASSDILGRRVRYVGLKNLGATCYMNCYLQTLYMNLDFRDRILSMDNSFLKSTETETQLDVLGELKKLFIVMQAGTTHVADPSGVARTLHISTDYQEDATEFATLLLMTLEKQLGGATSQRNFIPELFRGHQMQCMTCESCGNVSTRTDYFYELRVQLSLQSMSLEKQDVQPKNSISSGSTPSNEAPRRNRESRGINHCTTSLRAKKEEKNDATTGVSGVINANDVDHGIKRPSSSGLQYPSNGSRRVFQLETGLAQAFRGEKLRDDNRYMCNVCKKKVDAERRVFLTALPPYLHICFERYAYHVGARKKLTTLVDYPLSLNLKRYCLDVKAAVDSTATIEPQSHITPETHYPTGVNNDDEYELIGILEHHGSSALTGHYVAYIRDLSNPAINEEDNVKSSAPVSRKNCARFSHLKKNMSQITQFETPNVKRLEEKCARVNFPQESVTLKKNQIVRKRNVTKSASPEGWRTTEDTRTDQGAIIPKEEKLIPLGTNMLVPSLYEEQPLSPQHGRGQDTPLQSASPTSWNPTPCASACIAEEHAMHSGKATSSPLPTSSAFESNISQTEPRESPESDALTGKTQAIKKQRYHASHPKVVETPGAHRTISHKRRHHNVHGRLLNTQPHVNIPTTCVPTSCFSSSPWSSAQELRCRPYAYGLDKKASLLPCPALGNPPAMPYQYIPSLSPYFFGSPPVSPFGLYPSVSPFHLNPLSLFFQPGTSQPPSMFYKPQSPNNVSMSSHPQMVFSSAQSQISQQDARRGDRLSTPNESFSWMKGEVPFQPPFHTSSESFSGTRTPEICDTTAVASQPHTFTGTCGQSHAPQLNDQERLRRHLSSSGSREAQGVPCDTSQMSTQLDPDLSPSRTRFVGWVTTTRPTTNDYAGSIDDSTVSCENSLRPSEADTDRQWRSHNDTPESENSSAQGSLIHFNNRCTTPVTHAVDSQDDKNAVENTNSTIHQQNPSHITYRHSSLAWRSSQQGLRGGCPSSGSVSSTREGDSLDSFVIRTLDTDRHQCTPNAKEGVPLLTEETTHTIDTSSEECVRPEKSLTIASPDCVAPLVEGQVRRRSCGPTPFTQVPPTVVPSKRKNKPLTGVSQESSARDKKWHWIQFDDANVSEWKIENNICDAVVDNEDDGGTNNTTMAKSKAKKQKRLTSRSTYLIIYKTKNWSPTQPHLPRTAATIGNNVVEPVTVSMDTNPATLTEALDQFVLKRRCEVNGPIRDAVVAFQAQCLELKSKHYRVCNEWPLFQYCLSSMAFIPMSWWMEFICGKDYASLASSLPEPFRPSRATSGNFNSAVWSSFPEVTHSDVAQCDLASHIRTASNCELVVYDDILCPHYLLELRSNTCERGYWGESNADSTNESYSEEQKNHSILGSERYGIDPVAVWDGKAKLILHSTLRGIFKQYRLAASIPRIEFNNGICMKCANGFSDLVEYWFEQRTLLNNLCQFVRSHVISSVSTLEDIVGLEQDTLQENESCLTQGDRPTWVSRRVIFDLFSRFCVKNKHRKPLDDSFTLYHAINATLRELHRLRDSASQWDPEKKNSESTPISPKDFRNSTAEQSIDQRDDEKIQVTIEGEDEAVTGTGDNCPFDAPHTTRNGDSGASIENSIKYNLLADVICPHGKLLPDRKASVSRVLVSKLQLERFLTLENQRCDLLINRFLIPAPLVNRTRAYKKGDFDVDSWKIVSHVKPIPRSILHIPPYPKDFCSACETSLRYEKEKALSWKAKVDAEKALVGDFPFKRTSKLFRLHDVRRYASYCLTPGRHYLVPTQWIKQYTSKYLMAKDEDSAISPGFIDGRCLLTSCDHHAGSTTQLCLVYDPVLYFDPLYAPPLHPKDNPRHPESDHYVLAYEDEFHALHKLYGSVSVPYVNVTVEKSSFAGSTEHMQQDGSHTENESNKPPDTAASTITSVHYTHSVLPCATCVREKHFSVDGPGYFRNVTLRLCVEVSKAVLARQISRRQVFTVSADTVLATLVERVASAANIALHCFIQGSTQLWLEGPGIFPFYNQHYLSDKSLIQGESISGTSPSDATSTTTATHMPMHSVSHQPPVVWCRVPLSHDPSKTLCEFYTKIDSRWSICIVDS